MEFILNPFAAFLIFSSLSLGGLSLYIAFKLRDSTRWIALTMLSASLWGFFYGVELGVHDLQVMILLAKIQYVGISLSPAFWVIFSLKYTGSKWGNKPGALFLIGTIPVLTLLLVWTNELHHFHYSSTYLVTLGPFPTLGLQKGPWYFVHMAYSYLAFCLGNYIIWKRFRFSNPLFKSQTKLIFVAGSFPLVFNVFYQAGLVMPYQVIDLTPYAFLLTYLLLGLAIIRYNLFSIKPIAREKIMEAITLGVLVIDSNSKVVDFNPAILHFFPASKLIRTGVGTDVIFSQHPAILRLIDKEKRESLQSQLIIEGEEMIIKVEAIPLLEKKSILNGTVLLFDDITDQINTNYRLTYQARELRQLNDLKDKFFSIISHDLKGPILGAKELIYLTHTGIIGKDEFMELLPEVYKNMEQVALLLENLLAWSSSQLRGEHIQIQAFELHLVIQQQINLLQRVADEKHIRITFSSDEHIKVLADKNMIELVLRNLVNNAVKFSSSKSTIRVSLATEGNFAAIAIEDQGAGISPQNLLKLNEGVSFTTRGQNNESGTGLGMLLVKEYIQKNGGDIKVESEEGVGTRISVRIPLLSEQTTERLTQINEEL